MSAYVIGEIEVTDAAVYEDYRKQVLAVVDILNELTLDEVIPPETASGRPR